MVNTRRTRSQTARVKREVDPESQPSHESVLADSEQASRNIAPKQKPASPSPPNDPPEQPKPSQKANEFAEDSPVDIPLDPESLSIFSTDNASAFLRKDKDITRTCRRVIYDAYREQSVTELGPGISAHQFAPRRGGKHGVPLGPVVFLEVGPYFDCDQLWEELELRNKPVLAFARRRLRKAHMAQKMKQLQKESEKEQMDDAQDIEVDEGHVETNGELRGGSEGSESGSEEEAGGDDGSELEADEVEGKTTSKRRVSFALDKDQDEKESSEEEKSNSTGAIEDGFFSLADMEMFADEAEELAVAGKLMESDDEQDSDDPNSGQAQVQVEEPAESSSRVRYADFFDPPSGDKTGSQKTDRTSRLLESIDEEESDSDTVPTPLTASRTRSRRTISAMEEENVSKRPWQLRGEVTGHSRPQDSLLDTDMDHDSAIRPSLLSGEEKNETIEDIIRQRITDGLFDDVVRIYELPENYKKPRSESLPEVSQEKPSEGLADLYARDYMQAKENSLKKEQSNEVKKDTQDETPDQKEVHRLYEKLASRLDALAGIQYTPHLKEQQKEMSVEGNVMALKSEEAIPEGVSDASMLTPKETYSVDKKRGIAGEREVTKRERKSSRSKRKRARRNADSAKERANQLMQQSDPTRVAKRRAEEAFLRRGKKIRAAKATDSATLKTGASYFAPRSQGRGDAEVPTGQEPPKASNLIL